MTLMYRKGERGCRGCRVRRMQWAVEKEGGAWWEREGQQGGQVEEGLGVGEEGAWRSQIRCAGECEH